MHVEARLNMTPKTMVKYDFDIFWIGLRLMKQRQGRLKVRIDLSC